MVEREPMTEDFTDRLIFSISEQLLNSPLRSDEYQQGKFRTYHVAKPLLTDFLINQQSNEFATSIMRDRIDYRSIGMVLLSYLQDNDGFETFSVELGLLDKKLDVEDDWFVYALKLHSNGTSVIETNYDPAGLLEGKPVSTTNASNVDVNNFYRFLNMLTTPTIIPINQPQLEDASGE